MADDYDPDAPREPSEDVPPEDYEEEPTEAETKVDDDAKDAVDQLITDVLGDDADKQDVSSVAGAPDDATVYLSDADGKLHAVVQTDDMLATREIYTDEDGRRIVENKSMTIADPDKRGEGIGLSVLKNEVDQGKANDVDAIKTKTSAQTTSYYDFPLLAFDALLPEEILSILPKNLRGASTISDLMASEEGRKWWRENGEAMEVELELASTEEESVLDALLEDYDFKSSFNSKKIVHLAGIENSDLSDRDRRRLEKLWDGYGVKYAKGWNEDDHPRDAHGRFSSGAWDDLSGDDQQKIEDHWVQYNLDGEIDAQREMWKENLSQDVPYEVRNDQKFAEDTFKEWAATHGIDVGKIDESVVGVSGHKLPDIDPEKIPWTDTDQALLFSSMNRWEKLRPSWEEHYHAAEDEEIDRRKEEKESEGPDEDALRQQAEESLHELFGEISDSEKINYADDYNLLPEPSSTPPSSSSSPEPSEPPLRHWEDLNNDQQEFARQHYVNANLPRAIEVGEAQWKIEHPNEELNAISKQNIENDARAMYEQEFNDMDYAEQFDYAREAGVVPKPTAPAGSPVKVELPPTLDHTSRDKLLTSTVSNKERISANNSNDTYDVTLDNGARGVFKPLDGEDPSLRREVKGYYYMREAAAADVAEIVGMNDMVPTTVVREVDGRIGSFQSFVDNADTAVHFSLDKMYDGNVDLMRAAAFDYLIGNSDRHTKNWMVVNNDKLALIDNGLSFPRLNSNFYNAKLLGQASMKQLPIPQEVKDSWLSKGPAIKEYLEKNHFREKEVELTMKRLEALASAKNFKELREGDVGWDDNY